MNPYDQILEDESNAAGALALGAVGPSPERAAKAIALGGEAGVSPQIPFLNPEQFQKQNIEDEAAASIRQNPELQTYLLSSELAANVSSDDYDALNRLSVVMSIKRALTDEKQGLERLYETTRRLSEQRYSGGPVIEGFMKAFGAEPLGLIAGGETEKFLQDIGIITSEEKGGPIRFVNEALIRGVATTWDLFGRTGIGVLGAGAASIETGAIGLGEDPAMAARLRRDIFAMGEVATALPFPDVPLPREAVRTGIEVGSIDALMKEAVESKTRERSPASFNDFSHILLKDKTISIPAERVAEVYKEKGIVPAPGDELLGKAAPDIQHQLEVALATGGDIEIQLADYITHSTPELHEALLGDLRAHPDGRTITEIKEIASEPEAARQELQGQIDELSEQRAFLQDQADSFRTQGDFARANAIETQLQTFDEQIKEIGSRREKIGEGEAIPSPRDKPDQPLEPAAKERKRLFLDPLFEDAKAAGMTKEEFSTYSKRLEEIRVKSAEKVESAARSRAEQMTTEERRAADARLRPAAERAFDERADIAAEALLRSGGVKLSVEGVELPRGLVDPKGVDPDDIAGVLGYSSGEALVRDLAALHADRQGMEPKVYRSAMVERDLITRIEEEVGSRTERIREIIEEEVLSEPITKILHDDLRVMRRQNEGEDAPAISLSEMKVWAAEVFGQMSVKQAGNFKGFMRNVENAGRQAELALLKGKLPDAFKWKNQQLHAHLLAREAKAFQKEVAQNAKIVKRFSKEKVSGVSQEYTDQIQRLLLVRGAPIRRDPVQLADSPALREFVLGKEAEGRELPVADFIYDGMPQAIDEMNVGDFRAFMDSIKTLEWNGRDELTALRAGQKMERQALINEIVSNIETLPKRFKKTYGVRAKTKEGLYLGDAWLVRPEEIIDELDLGNPLGPLNDSVYRGLTEARFKEDQLFQAASERLRQLPKIKGSRRRIDTPFINPLTEKPYRLTKGDVVMMALNLGNKRNRDLLVQTLKGEDILARTRGMEELEAGISRQVLRDVAEQEVLDFVDRVLTPDDWKFVEGLWDFFREIKPEIDDLYRRTSGVAPDTVQPLSVGGRKGGYAPIIYDPVVSDLSVRKELSALQYDYHRATTPNSYTKKRTQVFKPLMIERMYDMLGGRIREMLHDIAFREAILNASKVIYDKRFRAAVNKYYGPEYGEQLDPWLQNVANRFNVEERSAKMLTNLLRHGRHNLIVQVLGFNLRTLSTPNIGPLLTEAAASPLQVARMMATWPRYSRFTLENSAELRDRLINTDRDVNEVLGSMVGLESPMARARAFGARAGMYLAVKMDTMLAQISWYQEYRRSIDKGMSHEDAVFVSDKLVRKGFGSHSRVDIPAMMRSSETIKLLTMFGGYLNILYNRTRDVVQTSAKGVRRVRQGDFAGARRDFAKVIADSLAFILVPAIFGLVYNPELIEDEDSWGEAAGKMIGSHLLSLVPLLRDVGSILQGYPARATPPVQIALQLGQAAEDAVSVFSDEGPSDQWVKHAINVPGYLFGLPTGQVATTSQFLWNLTTGQDEADTWDQFVRGVIYGKASGSNIGQRVRP